MQQFQYTDGYRMHGPYTLGDVEALFPRSLDVVQALDVGDSARDATVERVTWTRLPDEVTAVTDAPKHDERLERIALEYLRFMGPAYLAGDLILDEGKTLVSCCVTNAKHLIAELDKPEGNPFEAGL